jgi:hypothetical protein
MNQKLQRKDKGNHQTTIRGDIEQLDPHNSRTLSLLSTATHGEGTLSVFSSVGSLSD